MCAMQGDLLKMVMFIVDGLLAEDLMCGLGFA